MTLTGNEYVDAVTFITCFYGMLVMLNKWFGKKKNGNGSPSVPWAEQSSRLSVVETRVDTVEGAIVRLENAQERMRIEQREDMQSAHNKLDGITVMVAEIKRNGKGR